MLHTNELSWNTSQYGTRLWQKANQIYGDLRNFKNKPQNEHVNLSGLHSQGCI